MWLAWNIIIDGITQIGGGSRRSTLSRTQDWREVVTWGTQTTPDQRMSRATFAACTSHLPWTPLDPRASCGAVAARTSRDTTFVCGLGCATVAWAWGAKLPLARLGSAVAACTAALGVSSPLARLGVLGSLPLARLAASTPLVLWIGELPPLCLQIWESLLWLQIKKPPPPHIRFREPTPPQLQP
jgi:hypothetical protein